MHRTVSILVSNTYKSLKPRLSFAVTKQYQLEQATLKGKQFFFMDTPGFDEGSEVLLYNEIIRAIRDFDRRAQVTGILHISRINPARLEKWDAKLLVFLLAICGRHYLPRVTFVTTHWTAHHNQEKTAYNEHLRKLRAKWEDVTESVVNTYQHGRASADGAEDSEFLKWYEAREQIAFYAQVMICSRYGQGTLQNPQIVNELATGVDPLATMAAECLGISSSKPSSGTTNQTSGTGSTEHERGKADARTSERQSDNPQSGPSTNHQTQWQDSISPQTVETLGNLACKIGSSIFNSFFSGGGSLHGGVTSFPGSSSGFQWGKFRQNPKILRP